MRSLEGGVYNSCSREIVNQGMTERKKHHNFNK